MPLEKAPVGSAGFEKNIKTEIAAGKDPKQAVAIAYSKSGERQDADRPAAHIRHKGIMIDASFKKDGTVDYYVVEGSSGRFYSLAAAKEIAEHRAERKSRKDSAGSKLDALLTAADGLYARSDAMANGQS